MTDKYKGYYYEVEYHALERSTGNSLLKKATILSSHLSEQFPYTPTDTAQPNVRELEAVVTCLAKNLPADVEKVIDYKIERKDEFEESIIGVTRIATKLICKWSSDQTFNLTSEQEKVFRFIENQLMTIGLKWHEWKALFGSPYENVKVLQNTAPTSFSLFRESMMHDIMLSIRRLFDSAESGKSKGGKPADQNCTFEWLAKNLNQGNKRDEFSLELAALKGKIGFLTTWRHKTIAHNDYEHGLNKQLLPKVELNELEAIVAGMSRLMNIVQLNLSTNHKGAYMQYDTVFARGGADHLLNYLKRGVEHRDEAIKRLQLRSNPPVNP